jgi:hypothetical protein
MIALPVSTLVIDTNDSNLALSNISFSILANQADIPSTPIGNVPSGNVPSAPNAPRAPLSLVLPVAPLSAPSNNVSIGSCAAISYVLALIISAFYLV